MQTITLEATLDENHELHLTLPDLPPGRVELTVRPLPDMIADEREAFKNALRAAGLLAEDSFTEEELQSAVAMTEAEELELGLKIAGMRPVEAYVNEDREERF